ncbi:hypothetical protein [Nocardia sp. NPDC051832]|uniref:hypothetical protein n=1 Tax=Nocardia sp. NPDC051832 TaxID=3155673 RepID=UPI003435CC05
MPVHPVDPGARRLRTRTPLAALTLGSLLTLALVTPAAATPAAATPAAATPAAATPVADGPSAADPSAMPAAGLPSVAALSVVPAGDGDPSAAALPVMPVADGDLSVVTLPVTAGGVGYQPVVALPEMPAAVGDLPAAAPPVMAAAVSDPSSAAVVDAPSAAAAPGTGQSALAALQSLGVTPFLYPTAALCSGAGVTLTSPAVAGAVPGPWPVHNIAIPGLDLTAVKSGQTMFTFVPSGNTRSESPGMRVVWLNVDTKRGGVASMGPLDEVFGRMIPPEVPAALRPLAEQAVRDFFLATVPVSGIRAVPVDTGKGTVLAAVFGTMANGAETCFYLPTVGITTVP